MTDAELKSVIVEALRQVAPETDPAAVPSGASVREALGIDSYDFLSFLVGLHKTLGVEVPESDYGKLTSVDDMVGYLRTRI